MSPQFSAVKIDGERAYKRARDGEEMDIAARPLFVEELALVDRPDADHAVLEMVCGKGGYVRSIARDLGAALGCHGHVTALRWTQRRGYEAVMQGGDVLISGGQDGVVKAWDPRVGKVSLF